MITYSGATKENIVDKYNRHYDDNGYLVCYQYNHRGERHLLTCSVAKLKYLREIVKDKPVLLGIIDGCLHRKNVIVGQVTRRNVTTTIFVDCRNL